LRTCRAQAKELEGTPAEPEPNRETEDTAKETTEQQLQLQPQPLTTDSQPDEPQSRETAGSQEKEAEEEQEQGNEEKEGVEETGADDENSVGSTPSSTAAPSVEGTKAMQTIKSRQPGARNRGKKKRVAPIIDPMLDSQSPQAGTKETAGPAVVLFAEQQHQQEEQRKQEEKEEEEEDDLPTAQEMLEIMSEVETMVNEDMDAPSSSLSLTSSVSAASPAPSSLRPHLRVRPSSLGIASSPLPSFSPSLSPHVDGSPSSASAPEPLSGPATTPNLGLRVSTASPEVVRRAMLSSLEPKSSVKTDAIQHHHEFYPANLFEGASQALDYLSSSQVYPVRRVRASKHEEPTQAAFCTLQVCPPSLSPFTLVSSISSSSSSSSLLSPGE